MVMEMETIVFWLVTLILVIRFNKDFTQGYISKETMEVYE